MLLGDDAQGMRSEVENHVTPRRRTTIGFMITLVMGMMTAAPPAIHAGTVVKYRSARADLYTDLPANVANQRLKQIDRVIDFAARYWARPLAGRIRCYLVEDLAKWDEFQFPEPTARRVLRRIGGGTKLESGQESGQIHQSAVYATTASGVLEHEVVHAYCFQAFGRGGPDWYREGMAEVIGQQFDADPSIPCRTDMLQLLQNSPIATFSQLTQSRDFSTSLKDSVSRHLKESESETLALKVASPPTSQSGPMPWSETDHLTLQAAQVDYAQSWAVCYFLSQHRQYRERFRCYGQDVLSGADVKLADVLGAVIPQIDFELNQFLTNIDPGYRLDLCQWHWAAKQKSRTLEIGEARTVQVRSALGFQPAGIDTTAGATFRIVATGTWQVTDASDAVDADGDAAGNGQLEVVILDGQELSDATVLGKQQTWQSPNGGRVYFRCRDQWGSLSNNRGTMTVRVSRVR